MIRLEFKGDKPFISPKGVRFIKGKPDKYIYIPSAVKLYLLMHDESNWHGNKLEFEYPKQMMNDEQMLEVITKKNSKLLIQVEERLKEREKREDELIEQIWQSKHYDEKEKEVFVGNLKLMRSYLLQRNCNKILYHMLVKNIVDVIIKREIIQIKTPPSRSFYHLMDSIRSELIGKKLSSCVNVRLEASGAIGALILETNVCSL